MDVSISERCFGFVHIIIRVPLLFIIDQLLRIEHGLTTESVELELDEFYSEYPTYGIDFAIILKCLYCWLGCIAVIGMFVLWTKHLIIVYQYLISLGTIFMSYWSHVSTLNAINAYMAANESTVSIYDNVLALDLNNVFNEGPGLLVVQNYLLQSCLATIFYYVHLAPKHPVLQKLLIPSFVAPSVLGIYPYTPQIFSHMLVCATLLPLAVCMFVIWYNGVTILDTIYTGYEHTQNFISNYGLSAFAETEWIRLNVPTVLRIFWILRVAAQVIQILGNHYGEETVTYDVVIKSLLANSCENLTAVLGMTSIISWISHYIGCFFERLLLIEDTDEQNIGTVSAILFYILALQTGLTGLDKEKRVFKLCSNCCVLFTTILHFVHNIVHPLLMSLSASRNPALHRHVRAVMVSVLLIVLCASLLGFLWSHCTLSAWLLGVSGFSIAMIVKVLVSLAIYALFLIDVYSNVFWEQLDDCVYIIRSFGNTVEFAAGIVLFFNGFWVLVFESGGAIRAIMICSQAYFNIWCKAKAGWSVFMKRRSAVNKINSLPMASTEQLRMLDDVCAICYQEIQSARITRCNHYFHSVCLRKWLYVQDRCPLCQDVLCHVESS